jgi:hypothetical protein
MTAGLCNISVDWVDPERQTLAHKALARLKGLRARPEEILAAPPVIIARNVPLPSGVRVKGFLEKHGVAVTLEPCNQGVSVASRSAHPRRERLSEDILVQQICTQLSTKVPGFVIGTIKEGLTSMSTGVWKAGVGLFLGVLLGWVLGFLFSALYSPQGMPEMEILPTTTVYLYTIVINGLCGTALVGLKKNLKGAVLGNESVLELVDATVGNICRFLESNGLTTEGRKQFLSSLQGRITEERSRIHKAVQGGLKSAPLMRGISSRIARKILDAACRVPEMILLNMDMKPREGRGQKTMLVEGFFSSLDRIFGAAVDAAFSRTIVLTVVSMAILASLPFAAVIVRTALW